MRIDNEMHFRSQSHTLILACICLIALSGIHCGGDEDRAYSRGSTLVMAVPNVEAVKPCNWDLDFLTFLAGMTPVSTPPPMIAVAMVSTIATVAVENTGRRTLATTR